MAGFLEFDARLSIPFSDKDGVKRELKLLSVTQVFELTECVAQIKNLCAGYTKSADLQAIYLDSFKVRHWCDRILEMSGIDCSWLTWEMLVELVFGYTDADGKSQPGKIVALNEPKGRATKATGDTVIIDSRAAAIALISLHCSGIKEAYYLASNVSSEELWEVLRRKSEFSKTPKQRLQDERDRKFEEWKQRKLAEKASLNGAA